MLSNILKVFFFLETTEMSFIRYLHAPTKLYKLNHSNLHKYKALQFCICTTYVPILSQANLIKINTNKIKRNKKKTDKLYFWGHFSN